MNPQVIVIHGVRCRLSQPAADDYRVQRWSTGAEVARAERRLLAIARAAVILHSPGSKA